MGTNYYVVGEKCPCCGREDEDLHIGKSSAGWVFALNTHPSLGINTIADWLAFLNGKTIRDEYGKCFSLGALVTTIAGRRRDGEDFGPGWLSQNQAVAGPFGLARSSRARHGEGTWDYHYGDFS